MYSYFIESFNITQLWGYRNIDLTLNSDVNILIGPNGSGKTTILTLLHSILSGDLQGILNINFEQAEIKLRSFTDNSGRTVKVDITDGFLIFQVGTKKRKINIDSILRRRNAVQMTFFDLFERDNPVKKRILKGIDDELTALVPLVWLPVSRRLPVTEDEEKRYTRTGLLESVDVRLAELLRELIQYRSILNTQLSKRYKEFENQVLLMTLYNKEHEQYDSLGDSIEPSLPTESEKEQLLQAFEVAGLVNEQMRRKINDHFTAAEEVVKRIRKNPDVLELKDIFVLPLISRTRDMVEYARELEEDRKTIFSPLRRYEKTVNSFFNGKSVAVDDNGNLKIEFSLTSDLDSSDLSSGEKQILILLTQALLRVDEPVVYIADEPELSLHVTWQEKLLESLVTLSGDIQVIVATHSPDIVGKFLDKVIDLGEGS